MDLQQVLDRFKADLESYIKEEVARQLAAQGSQSNAQVAPAAASASAADIQASLDELAALVQPGKKDAGSDSVDQFASEFGMQSPQASVQASVVNNTVANTNDLSSLQSLGQRNYQQSQSSALDALSSLSVSSNQAETVPQPPQPSSSVMTDTSEASAGGQMSGIQSFLQKIRQRKNLSNSN